MRLTRLLLCIMLVAAACCRSADHAPAPPGPPTPSEGASRRERATPGTTITVGPKADPQVAVATADDKRRDDLQLREKSPDTPQPNQTQKQPDAKQQSKVTKTAKTAKKTAKQPRPEPVTDKKAIPDDTRGDNEVSGGDSPRPPPPPPSTTPPDPATPAPRTTLRAGALRLEGFTAQEYYVTYAADPGLTLLRVHARLGERPISAAIHALNQRPTKRPHEINVKRGGEIVALAVATQLKALAFRVDVADKELLLPKAGDFSDALVGMRFAIGGEVTFALHIDKARAAARLEGSVRFRRDGKEIIAAAKGFAAFTTGSRSTWAKRAATAALREFVRQVFAPTLDRQLAAAIPAL